jgi:hypothetical protein
MRFAPSTWSSAHKSFFIEMADRWLTLAERAAGSLTEWPDGRLADARLRIMAIEAPRVLVVRPTLPLPEPFDPELEEAAVDLGLTNEDIRRMVERAKWKH